MDGELRTREDNEDWSDGSRGLPTFGQVLRTLRQARRLRQVDLGGRVYLDHSTISRLENDERLPTVQEVDRIADTLGLGEEDRERLVAAYDRGARHQLQLHSDVLLRSDECLYLAEIQLEDARRLRMLGRPQLAAAVSGRTAAWLRLLARRSSHQATHDAVLRALGHVLVEQCKSHLDYILPYEVGDVLTKPLDEQRRIVQHLSDGHLDLLRRMNVEGSLYLVGDHSAAYGLSRTFAADSFLSPAWQPELLRAAAINAGYVRDLDALRAVHAVIGRVTADRADLGDVDRAFIFEGVARGQAAMGDHAAVATIERAEELIERSKTTSGYSAFRWVQVVRTKLRSLASVGSRPSRVDVQLAHDALQSAERYGYARHRAEIASLLDA